MNGYPPLAERMRPKKLDDYIGQKHLVGEGAVLRKMLDQNVISSIILWGPPGVRITSYNVCYTKLLRLLIVENNVCKLNKRTFKCIVR